MLRKRSRAVSSSSSKQGVMMSGYPSLTSPSQKSSKPIFASPRLLVGYSPKLPSEAAAAVSPTSILETKPFTSIGNPFFNDMKPRATAVTGHRYWDTVDSRAVGLGIVDALSRPEHRKSCNPESRMVLFGSQLKIQIPSIPPIGSVESPINSPIEFGVKNKSSQLALLSPALRSPAGCTANAAAVSGSLSADEMELSEDYTCVIAHGPNPRTTHIFHNCIVENCGGRRRRDGIVHGRRELNSPLSAPYRSVLPSDDFLAFCHACNKRLGPGMDIFMYRGEMAFCSSECRFREMMVDDEGMETASRDSSPDL